MTTRRLGFTLIELLVVLGIITLLIGILVPALGAARKSGQAGASQSNLKQWGQATINYTTANKERLPWEGRQGVGGSARADMEKNLLERTFWANAISILASEQPYSTLAGVTADWPDGIPQPGSRSIFIDPAAEPETDGPWVFDSSSNSNKKFYFNYVPNCRLNDSVATAAHDPKEVISMSFISDSAATVLMMEARSRRAELPATDPFAAAALDVCNADWHAFGNRHFEGGHVAFADGHVAHVLNDAATRSATGSRDPSEAAGDWNRPPKMIWNPKGAAGNVPVIAP